MEPTHLGSEETAGWEGGLGYGSWLGAHRTRGGALSLAGGESEGSASAGAQGSRAPQRGTLHVAGGSAPPALCKGFSRGLGSTMVPTSPSKYNARLGWGLACQAADGHSVPPVFPGFLGE